MKKYVVYPTKSTRGYCPTICNDEKSAIETLIKYTNIFPKQCWKIKVENN